jgi:glucokinase
MSCVVGVDLGGTKVAAALLNGKRLGDSVIEPTNGSTATALLDQLVRLVARVRSGEVSAVGIGAPSVVEFDTGRVVSSVNVPLADLPLRQLLGARLGAAVFIDNDAPVAALAEAHDERLRPVAHNLVMLTIGTGIGGGLVVGGRIYRGATSAAGEFGQTLVGLELSARRVAAPNGFPQPGSLESLASGRALDRLAAEAAQRHPASTLGRLRAEGKAVPGPDAIRAASEGDRVATRVVEVWAERVGIGIADAINTFDPDEVVIGGGGALAGELLLAPAMRVARAYALPGIGTRTTIRLARHGVRAGVLGAALLATMHESEES